MCLCVLSLNCLVTAALLPLVAGSLYGACVTILSPLVCCAIQMLVNCRARGACSLLPHPLHSHPLYHRPLLFFLLSSILVHSSLFPFLSSLSHPVLSFSLHCPSIVLVVCPLCPHRWSISAFVCPLSVVWEVTGRLTATEPSQVAWSSVTGRVVLIVSVGWSAGWLVGWLCCVPSCGWLVGGAALPCPPFVLGWTLVRAYRLSSSHIASLHLPAPSYCRHHSY